MKISLLTYNLLYNRAAEKLNDLIKLYNPSILCLQEVETTEINIKKLIDGRYHLADYANCFIQFNKIFGVATYYLKDKFRLVDSRPIPLSHSIYEGLFSLSQIFNIRGVRRTILMTDLYLNEVNKTITLYNVHLSAISLNGLRLKQLTKIGFTDITNKKQAIITGDFNFPLERKKLEIKMKKFGLKEATNNIFYTLHYPNKPHNYGYSKLQRIWGYLAKKIWTDKFKLDYIFYKGLRNTKTTRLETPLSDHFPILAEFEIT